MRIWHNYKENVQVPQDDLSGSEREVVALAIGEFDAKHQRAS
jgi:hypothetical protein